MGVGGTAVFILSNEGADERSLDSTQSLQAYEYPTPVDSRMFMRVCIMFVGGRQAWT